MRSRVARVCPGGAPTHRGARLGAGAHTVNGATVFVPPDDKRHVYGAGGRILYRWDIRSMLPAWTREIRSPPHCIALLNNPPEGERASRSHPINPKAPLPEQPICGFESFRGLFFPFICHSLALTACTSQPRSSSARQRRRLRTPDFTGGD